jgi:hypothetical protein
MFIFMYVIVTRRDKEKKVNHSEGNGGERVVAITRFQDGSPCLYHLRTA